MRPATVGELEEFLFKAFPREDAEAWDQPGLSVGDRSARIAKVAVALDQNVEAVLEAAEAGCNVLVTHQFVTGGARSGKSRHAEALIAADEDQLIAA